MPEDHNTKYNYSLIQQNYFLEFYYSVDTYVWQGKNGKRRENFRTIICFIGVLFSFILLNSGCSNHGKIATQQQGA